MGGFEIQNFDFIHTDPLRHQTTQKLALSSLFVLKMKVSSIANALVLLVGASCAGAAEDATPTLAECRSFCKEVRQGVLNDIDTCTPALPIGGGMKLFNACVGGRKKAFEQACVPTCAKAELSISSYEGCLNIAKGKGQKSADWCRKASTCRSIRINAFPSLLIPTRTLSVPFGRY